MCIVQKWHWQSGTCTATLTGHSGGVSDMALVVDTLVSCGFDKRVIVWSAWEGSLLYMFSGHSEVINCIAAIADDRVVTGSDDKSLCVRDAIIFEAVT